MKLHAGYTIGSFVARGCALIALAAIAFGPAAGCKKPKRRILTKEQQQLVAEAVLSEAPNLSAPVRANLGGKVELIGVEVEPSPLQTGNSATFTYYWRCLQPVEGDWKVFAHLEQPGKRQILDHEPVRGFYPLRQWKPGEIIRDEQIVEVDANFKAGKVTLWMGVFDDLAWRTRQESDRLKVENTSEVTTDDSGRVKALEVEVVVDAAAAAKAKAEAAAKQPPRYFARPSAGPVAIDGKLDELAWTSAPKTRTFLRPDGRPATQSMMTRAQIIYDDENLYIGFDVKDTDLQTPFEGRDQTLWEADVVEVFIDPSGTGNNYVELQVSPAGAVFDAIFESHRKPRWEEAAKVNLPIRSAVHLDGTLNDAADEDRGWSVEMAIPFTALPGVSGKPKPGTTWKVNLYRLDSAGPRNMAYQVTWAPVGGDFHNVKDAGDLTFADAPGGGAPPALPPAPEENP